MAQTTPSRIPGLIVGGTGSNAGKTVTTLALLCALRARGLRVQAAKSGPDFIDAAFHAALTGAPAANLDVWMCREARPDSGKRPLRRIPQGLARVFARMHGPGADGRNADLLLAGERPVPFVYERDMLVHKGLFLPRHSNALTLTAADADGATLLTRTYYSIGGGFIRTEEDFDAPPERIWP